jgi:hypothetical protein
MDIDPIETIIQWLETALTSANGRVAGKHRYGSDWTVNDLGVTVHADGGPFDLYAEVVDQRIELSIYGQSTAGITTVYQELIGLSRDNERFVVTTSKGNALVHYFYPESGLSFLYEDELKMDMGVVFFKSEISEEAVL